MSGMRTAEMGIDAPGESGPKQREEKLHVPAVEARAEETRTGICCLEELRFYACAVHARKRATYVRSGG